MDGKPTAEELKKRKRERAKENKKRRKLLKAQHVPSYSGTIPTITEDDLLAFQIAHFGDDTRPDSWFVDAEDALNFEAHWAEENDELGYYDDGVKRTLTDEQIAMFRHSEIQQLAAGEDEGEMEEGDGGVVDGLLINQSEAQSQQSAGVGGERPRSARPSPPVSEASSLEEELVGFASVPTTSATAKQGDRQKQSKKQSAPRRSESSESPANFSQHKSRQRGIAYDDRNKRKWEQHIEKTDPVEGSMTHRRIIRELDEQKEVDVDLDY